MRKGGAAGATRTRTKVSGEEGGWEKGSRGSWGYVYNEMNRTVPSVALLHEPLSFPYMDER
jgi:hypothetical protein